MKSQLVNIISARRIDLLTFVAEGREQLYLRLRDALLVVRAAVDFVLLEHMLHVGSVGEFFLLNALLDC
jgi:hypothetical protein